MSHYLLSTFSPAEGEVADAAPSLDEMPEQDMQERMKRLVALEAAMEEKGSFVFSGHLHGADAATVVNAASGKPLITDGPFVEAKEHVAGFYVLEADDLDDALEWAGRVSACVGRPIEVRPFGGTGRVADQMPPAG